MKRVKKTVVFYSCGKCRTEYASRKLALNCEKGSCEPRRFGIGDLVRAVKPRFCSARGNRRYAMRGKIVKIVGLSPYDSESMVKGFGIERTYAHCYWYEVEYRCPRCRAMKTARYPTEALRLVRSGQTQAVAS